MLAPSDDVLASSDDLLAPSGDLHAPSGDVLAPSGDVLAPIGDVPAPIGDVLAPSGGGRSAALEKIVADQIQKAGCSDIQIEGDDMPSEGTGGRAPVPSCPAPAITPRAARGPRALEDHVASNHTFIVVLRLPRKPKALITFASSVHAQMGKSPYFPTPDPPLAELDADIKALSAAETSIASKTVGTTEARDAAKRKLNATLHHLRDYVQRVVENLPASQDAAVVVASAFMALRKVTPRVIPPLRVTNDGFPGRVLVEARAVAPTATYFWQYSLDQQTWISAPETMQARTTISGLTPATTYYFRFRALTRAGDQGYSQVVSLVVH